MSGLSLEDHARIADAVAAAETRTSGEILCAVTDTVSDYPETRLGWAVAAALLVPPLLLAAGLRLESLAAVVPVSAPLEAAIGGYIVLQAVVFFLVSRLLALPGPRRALTSRAQTGLQVRRAAVRHFAGARSVMAPGQPAVLIFAALGDRRLEIIATPAINEAVADGVWAGIAAAAVEAIKRDGPAAGLVLAVERCGAELARAFPDDGESNQAPNAVAEV